ncbi:hypothetical protein CLU79DRAFT_709175 [Phycomyces nitens]|nr:hypothetical protein CLU79DRAFT_709175 [Phycomyces nitens]
MANPRKTNDVLPEHIPIDMAMAPQVDPYKQTHKIQSPNIDQSSHDLSQHSLSPEKLGVAGYVKDVAGFVKDAAYQVFEHVEHGKDKKGTLESPTSVSSSPKSVPILPVAHSHQEQSSHTQARSPLAEAVTSLFPGIDEHGHGCEHAESLRREMRTHNGTIQPGLGGSPPLL